MLEQKVELAVNNSVWLKPSKYRMQINYRAEYIYSHVSYMMFLSMYNFMMSEAGMKTWKAYLIQRRSHRNIVALLK